MEGFTVGHVLMIAAAADALGAAIYASRWLKYKDELRGTPLYARRRDARRLALLMGAVALVLLAIALLTPLRGTPLLP
jgi:hypothetical protein